MTNTLRRTIAVLAAALLFPGVAMAEAQAPRVILVVIDGVRWQELFRGADPVIAADKERTSKAEEIARTFVAPADRATALTPFLHSLPAKGGILIGDRDHGGCMRVANPFWFSYPGYNELLTGRVDPRIASNDPVPNANVTVLEWLNRRPDFAGRVRAFGTWKTFHAIFNDQRSGIPVNAGLEPLGGSAPDVALIDKLQNDTPHPWSEDERFDAFTHAYALRSLRVDQPRMLYVGYGEPDSHAHAGTYDEYLLAIHRADRFVKELWDAAQGDPAWAGRTTLIVTTDHGRGAGTTYPDRWTDHGSGLDRNGVAHPNRKAAGSQAVWAAIIGPAPLRYVPKAPCATAGQIAATVVGALDLDWRDFDRTAPSPLIE
ncbi:alkaline phosphatase family protein [Sphingomonas sp. GB1N7]|uniref:alkaline phosphatase family protein n=1 Tax=Parasphingomonas caseinilytica TaxID=3096158 RepID=UPI002FCB2533